MLVNNGCEDFGYGVVIKWVNGYNIYVLGKLIWDVIMFFIWGIYGRNE